MEGVNSAPTASAISASLASRSSRMRRKRIQVSSGTYCMAPAQLERRMMSQMDFTAALTDPGEFSRFPFPFFLGLAMLFLLLIRCMTIRMIESFSRGALSAHHQRDGHRAVSAIRFSPSAPYNSPFFSMNQRKRAAAIRLFPSTKLWFLTQEIKKMSALLLESRINVLPIEGLKDRIEGAVKTFVLFSAEDRGRFEFFSETPDDPPDFSVRNSLRSPLSTGAAGIL